tara:strand:- start:15506 stop:16702 length:1197 start_codon:yes stop_codon:yes gene_type:complete
VIKKSILIFIEDGPVTYDNRVRNHISTLIKNNYDITVLCPKLSYNKNFFEKVNSNYRVYYYPKLFTEAESIFAHIIEHLSSLFLGFLFTLYIYFKYGFKIFHACNPTDILFLIYLPYKLLKVKFIFDQHDLCPEVYLSRKNTSKKNLLYKVLILLEKYSYKFSSAVISTNNSYKNNARNRGKVDDSKIFVVRNGPNLEKFNLSNIKKNLRNDDCINVGYVGNMNMQDGVDEIIYIAEIIIKKYRINNIKFIMIGSGPQLNFIKKKCHEKKVLNYFNFLGRVTDDILLSSLYSCDIGVQPDPYNYLNNVSTMNKIMEYMALKLPFVSYDLIESRYSGGKSGLYAEVNNRDDFAKKIILLSKNQKLRNKMSSIGRYRIENKLSWQIVSKNLIECYDFVLK